MPVKAAISLNLYGFVPQTYQTTPITGTVLGHKNVFQQMLTMIYDSHFSRVLWHSYNSFVLRACKSHFTHPQCQGKAIVSMDQREWAWSCYRGSTQVSGAGNEEPSSAKAHLTKRIWASPGFIPWSPTPSFHPGGQLTCSTCQCHPFQTGTMHRDRAWAPNQVQSRASAPSFFLQQKLPKGFWKMDNNSPRRNLATTLV